MKGSSIVSNNQKISEEARAGVYTSNAPPPIADSPAQVTSSFPRRFDTSHAGDDYEREKMQLVSSSQNGMTPFGMATVTDKDIRWLQKKKEAEAYANLDQWVGTNFHNASVVDRKWLQETFPDYYDSREQLMVDRAKLALRINLLLLRGPKNEKDLLLEWGLQTGRIQLEDGWDKIGMPAKVPGKEQKQGRFQKQLFAPNRAPTDATRKAFATQRDPDATANRGQNPFRPANGNYQSDTDGFSGVNYVDPVYPTFLKDAIAPQIN